jgi:trimeric autotransporter adhesin
MHKFLLLLASLVVLAPFAMAQHTISTVAGGGPNVSPSLQIGLNQPDAVFEDPQGNLYVAVTGSDTIYKIDPNFSVTTIAGIGTAGFGGDGGLAIAAKLNAPSDVFVDSSGNIFIADTFNQRIREVSASTGNIQTIAGTGSAGYNGDGIAATAAELNNPTGVVVDGFGNVFIADANNNRIREISALSGIIFTVAGTGVAGFNGEGIPSTRAQLNFPSDMVMDTHGNIFISDQGNFCIREVVAASGLIQAFAGTCGKHGSAGDGGPAASALLQRPVRLFADGSGNVFITDIADNRVREVVASPVGGTFAIPPTIKTVAGTGAAGFTGDGGLATQAKLNEPSGVFVDGAGNIFLTDVLNNRVREVVVSTGNIQTIAGNGTIFFGGDGGPATSAQLSGASAVSLDAAGDIFIVDGGNNRIREVVAATGNIQTVAGNGTQGLFGDGGLATNAGLFLIESTGVFVDGHGNVFIADVQNNRIREVVAAGGSIQTIAGKGTNDTPGFSGDGGLATNAELDTPFGVFVDGHGNVFIADSGNGRIREVFAATGIIQTVVGGGTGCDNQTDSIGDGCPATDAQLVDPTGVFVDGAGDLFIADTGNNRIREVVTATGNIQTIAGNGTSGFSGDGGPAINAAIAQPTGVFVDLGGNIFIADSGNNRVREIVAATGDIETVVGNGTPGFAGDGGPALNAELNTASGLAGDQSGNLFIADFANNRIRKVVGLVTGAPANIVATSGTPQSATILTAFAVPLVATVTDASGSVIPGVTVTFTAPTSGASGTFAGGINTVVTNASGIATSPVFTANSVLGGYNVTASIAGVAQTASFSLTNLHGLPAKITATSGTPQNTVVSTPFAAPLVATVTDTSGNVIPGVTVTFTAPTSGASGTFAGGINTVVTNASGIATSPVFTANSVVGGPYNVTASIAGVAQTASFSLTNLHGPPAKITATSGTPQNTVVSTPFAAPLVATVTDTSGNVIPGVTVTFTAPTSGASGTFAGGINTVVTNASGIATSPVFTANSVVGGPYNVTASIAGVAQTASFSLTNLHGPPAKITATSGTPQNTVVSTPFAAPLVATVTDTSGNVIPGVTVTFTAPTSGASGTFAGGINTAVTNASGIVTSPVFTANSVVGGPYIVTASVAGLAQTASFSLTNTLPPPPGTIAVQVLPQTSSLALSTTSNTSTQTFYAQDNSGNFTPVTWSVSATNNANPGTITPIDDKSAEYTAPITDPGSPITVTATSVFDPTKSSSSIFPLKINGLGACCVSGTGAGLQVVVAAGQSGQVGAQLSGVPSTGPDSTVVFNLSCTVTNNDPQGAAPQGIGCLFQNINTDITPGTITGANPESFCTIFTTGSSSSTAAMPGPTTWFGANSRRLPLTGSVVCFLALLCFALWNLSPPKTARNRRYSQVVTCVLLVVVSVGFVSACGGFSKPNVPTPAVAATKQGNYKVHIHAVPSQTSGGTAFVQSELIVPLTVN